jgi:hypothetical protein
MAYRWRNRLAGADLQIFEGGWVPDFRVLIPTYETLVKEKRVSQSKVKVESCPANICLLTFALCLTRFWLMCHRIQHDVNAESISIGRELIEKAGVLAFAFP